MFEACRSIRSFMIEASLFTLSVGLPRGGALDVVARHFANGHRQPAVVRCLPSFHKCAVNTDSACRARTSRQPEAHGG